MTKILLIEDDEFVRENVIELLDAEGFDTVAAENGLVGSQLACSERPDVIVCDVMMPELDGYKVLEFIRQHPRTSTTPFIFLTAKSAKADFRQGMELGADDFLTKPFTRQEILGAIYSQLRKRTAVEQRYTSALKQVESQLQYLVSHDRVTALPNRRVLQEKFEYLARTFVAEGETIAVACLCLDRFSRLCETLSQDAEELLLRTVAQRLQKCAIEGDLLASLRTNQFAVVPAIARGRTEIEALAERILAKMRAPIRWQQQEVFVTASLGIATCSTPVEELEALLARALAAANYAETQGGDRYQFARGGKNSGLSVTLALETDLHHALERNEFQVYYQPRVSLATGKITGMEALLRWFHPRRGKVSPGQFIPLAEATGAIVPIGEWVCRTACEQTCRWHRLFGEPLRVAVNISSRQLELPDLAECLHAICRETHFDPRLLELELTETSLVQNPEAAREQLQRLHQLGIKIAIDDFGTGYSSLNYLKQFPFDILKIDRCFVSNIDNDSLNSAIAMAILQMATSLELQTVAEGVETEAELAFLRQHPCDEIQGYYFSPPLSAEDFEELLRSRKQLS